MINKMKLLLSVIILTNNLYSQSLEQVKRFMDDSTNIQHTDIVLSQSILETGWFKSYNTRVRHNLFGFWNSRLHEFFKYTSWQESVKSYERWQKKWYKDGDYYEFLECLYQDTNGKCIRYASDPNYIDKLKKIKKHYKFPKETDDSLTNLYHK